ncbi:MAG: hypothetical protein JXL97_00495 [Bacteroidales bacterium]|nr:hypothetical protein [Bacteroidales bacterium]
MKKITLVLSFLLVAIIGFAQTPNQFKYQAVIRDNNGDVLVNQSVDVQIDIIKTNVSGTVVFTETHNVTTSANGVVSLNVGSVEDMSSIDWNTDDYFIRVSVNGTEMGTSQLLSVPYAITAEYATAAGVFTDMAIVTGTTNGSGGSVDFNFPTGYNQTNCLVAACGIEATVGSFFSWRSIGTTVSGVEGSIYVSLSTTTIWLYYPAHADYQGKNFKIVLMKLD